MRDGAVVVKLPVMSRLAIVMLIGCAAAPPAAPPPANVTTAIAHDKPHAAQDGLRGFEDGQPITRDALAGWVPGSDVIEHVPAYFVIVAHGVRLPQEELDSVVPAGALAVIDYRQPFFPQLIVMGAGVTNPWGVTVGMSIGDAMKRVPGLTCGRGDTPLCAQPHSRIHFVTERKLLDQLHVAWWVWQGSGRPRSVYRAAVADWRFEAGGIGPIDGMTPPTVEAIGQLAPGLTVTPDGDRGFLLARGGELVVHLRGRRDELSQMEATTPAIATRAGVRVGQTLAELSARVPDVRCDYRVKDPDLGTTECGSEGVRFWLGTHPQTPRDRVLADANTPVDLAAAAGLVIDKLETELY